MTKTKTKKKEIKSAGERSPELDGADETNPVAELDMLDGDVLDRDVLDRDVLDNAAESDTVAAAAPSEETVASALVDALAAEPEHAEPSAETLVVAAAVADESIETDVPQSGIDDKALERIIEGAILAAGEALSMTKLLSLFEEREAPSKEAVLSAIVSIQAHCEGRGYNLVEVASGWRFQVEADTAPWVNRLWEEKPQKYSRALLETLALVAYRQPITRGDIEEVRGVAVSSHIIKTLTEREWVKVVGHRDVPGRPALYATTKAFLDYFSLKSLDELPTLGELKDIDGLNQPFAFDDISGVDTDDNSTAVAVNDEAGEMSSAPDAHDKQTGDFFPDDAVSVPPPQADERASHHGASQDVDEQEVNAQEVNALAADLDNTDNQEAFGDRDSEIVEPQLEHAPETLGDLGNPEVTIRSDVVNDDDETEADQEPQNDR